MSNKHKRNGYQPAPTNELLQHVSSVGAKVLEQAAETKILPRAPYQAEEMTFTTRQGGPTVADLMTAYINEASSRLDSGLLAVHPIPANNSFLFIWETLP